VAVRHLSWSAAARDEDYIEHGSLGTRSLYAAGAIETHDLAVRLDRPQPTFMRAPHEGPGMVGIEIAMDELAHALGIDPVELRLRNYADREPTTGQPFSSKALRECYRLGADAFGWARRNPQPGSHRDGSIQVGWGMATALMSTFRFGASARVTVTRAGRALIETAAHEIGTGVGTTLARIASGTLGIPFDRIDVVLGDTTLPEAGGTFGSATTLSVGSAVQAAAVKLRGKLETLANEPGLGPDEYPELLALHRLDRVAEEASWAPGKSEKLAMNAYGAVFAEVRVDPGLPVPRVSRLVGAYSIGRVIDPAGARAQVIGGLTWGLGQALLEESRVDPNLGRFVAKGFGGYQVPVAADVPDFEVIFADEVDRSASAVGARGVGEIGTIGVGAAIANAVFHATGIRVRRLPIRVEDLMR
jgi:xanthine dehydrogenase YagR molybdenum-binding subunit